MRRSAVLPALLLALLVGALPIPVPGRAEEKSEAKGEKPHVVILATGGTIAGSAKKSTEAGYKPGTLSVEVLIEAVPELAEVARVTGEQVSNIASQDMTDALWLKLAKRVNALLEKKDVAGVVITHGTDTMEETAYFLHLTVSSEKPVVLTGAMRAATSLSADGALNLYDAVAIAAAPESRGRGVLVALSEKIHGARWVTKTHTSSVPAFSSPVVGPIGAVQYGAVTFFRRPERAHTVDSPLRVDEAVDLPRVLILYAHANLTGVLVDAAVEAGAKGIVMAGVGNGNASASALDAMEKAAKAGVVVVRSSRVLSGPVGRNLEIDDDKRGFVAADTLNPQKARILLKLALAAGKKDPGEIQELFYRY